MISADQARAQTVSTVDACCKDIEQGIVRATRAGKKFYAVSNIPALELRARKQPRLNYLPVPDKLHDDVMAKIRTAGYKVEFMDLGTDYVPWVDDADMNMFIVISW
jgi:hypothetical protein